MDRKKEIEREGLLEKEKKGLVLKTLERCRSLGQPRRLPMSPSSKTRTSPKGYLTVCVGIEKERFTIKMECMSHHLFRPLLDHAEMEYGFSAEGPLEIPSSVDVFLSVLKEMDQEVVEGAN